MVVFWFVAFVAVATIVGVGEVVVKFAVIAGSKKKLGFVKALMLLNFNNNRFSNAQYSTQNYVLPFVQILAPESSLYPMECVLK